ncbi:MAG: MFS transporter [Kiritimatiellae bacterium]|nr:MFS transporter [Kiritimatiellia bacterium]
MDAAPATRRPAGFTRTDLRVVFLLVLGYSCAYLGRLDMGASILAMSRGLGWSNETLGSVVSCFFVAYACGQLASGILAHFFDPFWSFGLALAGSALCNLAVPFSPGPAAMRAVWFANGAMQSMLWCSLVKAMAQRVSEAAMPRAIVCVCATLPFGSVAAFGAAAAGAPSGFWQGTFYLAAAGLGLSAALWFRFYRFGAPADGAPAAHAAARSYPRATRFAGGAGEAAAGPGWRTVAALVAATALSCGACGYLRDGLSTWAPKVLQDAFGLPASLSILLTLVLPFVGLAGAFLNKRFHERQPLVSAMTTICFAVGTASAALALLGVGLPSLALAVAAFAGVYLAMVMVTNAITSIFCLAYRRLFDAALVAGIVDTVCYVGSSLAAWSLGRAVDSGAGWTPVFAALALSGAAGLLFSFVSLRLERRVARGSAR